MSSGSCPSVSAVADVLALHGERGWLTPPLSPVVGARPARCGVARTVQLRVGEPGASGQGLAGIYDVLSTDLAGAVVVVAGAWPFDGCVWGEILTVAAARAGALGAVVDGRVRDVAELAELGLPVFARATGVAGPQGRVHLAGVDVPVTIDGQRITPGDTVVLDDGGAVVVAPDRAAVVLEQASAYAGGEAKVVARLEQGEALRTAYVAKRDVMSSITQNRATGSTPPEPSPTTQGEA